MQCVATLCWHFIAFHWQIDAKPDAGSSLPPHRSEPDACVFVSGCVTGEKPHVCGQCGESFAQSGTLKEHMQKHTGIKPFQCQLCGSGFSSSTHLNRHQRNVKCSRKLFETE